MPAGEELTDPAPVPDDVTARVLRARENVAVTLLAVSIVTWHGAVPEQAPPQPVKVELAVGDGVSWTTAP
jgi:hypothetical protein